MRILMTCTVVLALTHDHSSERLPAAAAAQLRESLAASMRHDVHVWRDTPPRNEDGSVNAFIEISRGDRRKWELNIARNRRVIDRWMPADPGGYPVNYGIVPQTVSFDGDPLDVLVLGAPIEGGRVVRGVIVGLMLMEDEKGPDSKVVVSRVSADGRPFGQLTERERTRIGTYFARYKLHEPGKFSRVPGWEGPEEARRLLEATHRFFTEARSR
jgi:inorganic pyrophosphatase